MADIKDNAYTILRNDFLNIKPENGFENTVKAVYEGERLPSQMPDKPAVCIVFDIDSQKEELVAEQEEIRILPILIYIFYQATLDTCAELKKSLIRDFDKMFYRSNSILSDYHSHLKQAGIRTEYHIRAYDPEFTPLTQNQGCIAIRIDLDYYKNADIVDSYSFSLTSIPTADSRFTLTSVTEALQNRVNELAISGANVWGTISGSLSAQTDLQLELDARSLTGHTHNDLATTASLNNYTTTASFIATTATLTGATLWTKVGTNAYYTTTSDRVGIGYTQGTALGYMLDVGGHIRATGNLYTNSALYSDVAIWSPVFKPRYNTAFTFQNYYNTALGTVLSGGNWGIGTLTPAEKFSVSGNLSVTGEVANNNIKLTTTGGYAISMSAAETLVAGNVVHISADGRAAKIVQDVPDPIGAVLSGATAGQLVWVVVSGIADVLFSTSALAGNLARGFVAADTGFVAGQALSEPVPANPFLEAKHFYEIGHCLETKSASGLAKCVLHFN